MGRRDVQQNNVD